MSRELRPYQQDMQRRLMALPSKTNALVVAPTGAGKTFMIASLVDAKKQKTLIVVHRDYLADACSEELSRFDIPHGVIAAGFEPDSSQDIQIATIQTLQKRDVPEASLIILDEAHTTSHWKEVRRILKANPQASLVGFTATPWRTRKDEGLGKFFTEIISTPGYKDLISNGYLVNARYFGYPPEARIDLSGVKMRGEDYDIEALSVAVNTPIVNQNIVKEYQRIAGDRKGIVYAVNVEHAKHLSVCFNAANINAGVILGEDTKAQRREALELFESGEIQVLINVAVLIEGFNSPSASAVVIARPTQSSALHVQMIGRGLRTHPGKENCIVLDFADNVLRHGRPDDIEKWSLEYPTSYGEGQAPFKQCPECNAIVGASAKNCPECQHEFEGMEKVEIDAQLQEIETWKKEMFAQMPRPSLTIKSNGFEVLAPVEFRQSFFEDLQEDPDKEYEFSSEIVKDKVNQAIKSKVLENKKVPCESSSDLFNHLASENMPEIIYQEIEALSGSSLAPYGKLYYSDVLYDVCCNYVEPECNYVTAQYDKNEYELVQVKKSQTPPADPPKETKVKEVKDFTGVDVYSTQQAENLTGVPSATIRSWKQRGKFTENEHYAKDENDNLVWTQAGVDAIVQYKRTARVASEHPISEATIRTAKSRHKDKLLENQHWQKTEDERTVWSEEGVKVLKTLIKTDHTKVVDVKSRAVG